MLNLFSKRALLIFAHPDDESFILGMSILSSTGNPAPTQAGMKICLKGWTKYKNWA